MGATTTNEAENTSLFEGKANRKGTVKKHLNAKLCHCLKEFDISFNLLKMRRPVYRSSFNDSSAENSITIQHTIQIPTIQAVTGKGTHRKIRKKHHT